MSSFKFILNLTNYLCICWIRGNQKLVKYTKAVHDEKKTADERMTVCTEQKYFLFYLFYFIFYKYILMLLDRGNKLQVFTQIFCDIFSLLSVWGAQCAAAGTTAATAALPAVSAAASKGGRW